MDQTTLLLARSFAIVVGGLFSWSMIDLVVTGDIRYYLADQKFKHLVLAGGVMLAGLVLLKLRALALATHGHHHHHDHNHAHDDLHHHDHHHHDHHHHGEGECEHDHADECCHEPTGAHHHHEHGGEEGHVHEHGVSLWRYIVLAVPLIIIRGGMAPQGLSAEILTQRMSKEQMEAIASVGNATLPAGRVATGEVTFASIKQLQDAASDPQQRDFWQSNDRPVRVKTVGQFVPDSRYTNRYRLMRIKITCCAADATPVGITVMGSIDPKWQHGDWLEVVGPVSFLDVPNARTGVGQYFAIVHQQHVESIPQPSDLYLQ